MKTQSTTINNDNLITVIETTYQQKEFIKLKLTPVVNYLNSSSRKMFNDYRELIRENGEYKNFIGIDFDFDKKTKKLNLLLFFGKYEKLNNDDDYCELIDTVSNNELLSFSKKELNLEEIIHKVTNFFNEKLDKL